MMLTCLRRSLIIATVFGSLLGVCGLAQAAEPAAERSLVLTNEDLNRTSESLRAAVESAPVETLRLDASQSDDAGEVLQLSLPSGDDSAVPTLAEPQAAETKRTVSWPPAEPVNASSFETCMETSIRAGNGYRESERVCRALERGGAQEGRDFLDRW